MYVWKSTVLKSLFFFKVVQINSLLNGWGKESWKSSKGWDQLGAGQNQPEGPFFLYMSEFFVLHTMVRRTQREFTTPGYFDPLTFLHMGIPRQEHWKVAISFWAHLLAQEMSNWSVVSFKTTVGLLIFCLYYLFTDVSGFFFFLIVAILMDVVAKKN